MQTEPRSGAFASDWVLMLVVPLALMQPTIVSLVAGPAFMGQQWDRREAQWTIVMLAALSVSYATWVCRWTAAAHVAPLIRLLAVVLLAPGFLTTLNFLVSDVLRFGSTPSGPRHGSNADVRFLVLSVAAAVTVSAVVAAVHDRRRRRAPAVGEP